MRTFTARARVACSSELRDAICEQRPFRVRFMAAISRLKQELHRSIDGVFDNNHQIFAQATNQATQTEDQNPEFVRIEHYRSLQTSFDNLEKYCRDLQKALKVLEARLRISKQRRKEWEDYSTQDRSYDQASPTGLDRTSGNGHVSTSAPPISLSTKELSENHKEYRSHPDQQERGISPSSDYLRPSMLGTHQRDVGEGLPPGDKEISEEQNVAHHRDDKGNSDINNDQSSSPPVIISEKCLKRKRRGKSPEQAMKRIKDEPSSSPPTITNCYVVGNESLDLDRTGQRITTPRKRRDSRGSRHSSREITILSDDSNQLEQNLVSDERKPEPKINHRIAVRDFAHSLESPRHRASALTPKDANARVLPRTYGKSPHVPSSRRRGVAAHVAAVSEDGMKTPKAPKSPALHKDNHRARLQNLLKDTPSHRAELQASNSGGVSSSSKAFEPTVPRQTTKTVASPASRNSKTALNNQAKIATPTCRTTSPKPLSSVPITPIASRPSAGYNTRPTPSITPYRSLPTSLLTPSHFKPNPTLNFNLPFPVRDSLRTRASKACVPGCRLPCCLPALTALAENLPPLSPTSTVRLLEHHLGDESYKIPSLTSSEKAALVKEARIEDLGRKAGKHKYTVEGQREPPGFWDVDFPTTQEGERDREEAERVEREVVLEREREARKEGGRWRFGDEI